jgi:peptidoglycan hydrolase-like protein with peptidoglycan-binding domain
MKAKSLAMPFLALSLAAAPVTRAAADGGDALLGVVVGGVIGAAIANEAHKKKKSSGTTTRSSSGQSSAQREANREVQVALNYFGYPVGSPDGQLGPKSRAAISEYQITMGFPPTGTLNEFERDLLVSSYYRAQAGGATTASLIATNPQGVRGVLVAWKNERLGVGGAVATAPAPASNPFAGSVTAAAPAAPVAPAPASNPFAGSVTAAAPAAPAPAAPAPVFVTAPAAPAATGNAVPSFAAAAPAAAALPSFMGAAGAAQVSLSSHCSKVSLVTNSNGGFVTQVTMTDPAFALSEQFCLARTYAMAQSEDMISKIAGFTPQQIAEQCMGFAPALKSLVDAASVQPRETVTASVADFAAGAGMPPAQLAGTAKTCLGVGYTTDNMDLALGSALILSVLAEPAYAELVGHHLAAGIGASSRPDLALPWFEASLGSASSPVVQVFAPGMADRAGLIRMAAYSVAGQPMPGAPLPVPAPAPAAVIAPAPAPSPAPSPFAAPAATGTAGGGGGGFALPKLPFIGGGTANP